MEPTTVVEIDLFADELPSMDEIERLTWFVHSSESNLLKFAEQVEGNMARTSPRARLAVGIGLCILGRFEEAVAKLSKGKDCKEKFIYSGFALRRMGKFDEAIENLQKSLGFEADTLNITLEKVATYRRASDFDAAAKELKACANFENVSAEYHYQLARLQEAQGLYEEALDNYKTALELSPNHQRALFHLAYRCDVLGDEEAAIDFYKQIVSTKTMFFDEEKERKRTRKSQILETPISDFELSVRSRNCLKKMHIDTLGDLLNITETELLSYKNFGETSLMEIKTILTPKGLHLGMALEEKQSPSEETAEQDVTATEDEELMNKPVEDLQLSVRARKCLQKLNIHTIGDLTRKTEAELLGCKNFGVTSLNEIKRGLANIGLSLRSLD